LCVCDVRLFERERESVCIILYPPLKIKIQRQKKNDSICGKSVRVGKSQVV